MSKIVIKKLSVLERFLDMIMLPIMMVLGKFKVDSIQETHPWHVQEIDLNLVDLNMVIKMLPKDKSIYKKRNLFLFHAPLFGGWTRYTVFEVDYNNSTPFFIGWVDHKKSKAFINRLPIFDRKIRLLNGTELFKISVFAVSSGGTQIPVSRIGEGKLGTNVDKYIRLL